MRTSQNWTAKKMGLLTTLLLLPVCAWSQATSSLLIPLNNQTIQRVDNYNSKIDLLKEARLLKPALKNVSNIEIQMVRVEAKSGVGGAQIFLKVNNDLVAAAAVETNPDLFSSTDVRSFEKFELKSINVL